MRMIPDIIYEDQALIVVRKPAGMESQGGKSFSMDQESQIRNYLAAGVPGTIPYVGVVHRLDRPVAGVMVYAKTKKAAADLSRQLQDGSMKKEYEALVLHRPEASDGMLTDFLFFDRKRNFTTVVSKDAEEAKEARLTYRVIPEKEAECFRLFEDPYGTRAVRIGGRAVSLPEVSDMAVLRIQLLTGRHHQIRVQLAHAGMSIFADTRYGTADAALGALPGIGLCAVQLTFLHPVTRKQQIFRYTQEN